MVRKKKRIPGLTFSLSRALGVSSVEQKIAKATGVSTIRAGRQRKVGAATGCVTVLALPMAGMLVTWAALAIGGWL